MDYSLITGATSGIGYELAKLFVHQGYGMVLVSSSEERLQNKRAKNSNISFGKQCRVWTSWVNCQY